jgi:hypothetical protein
MTYVPQKEPDSDPIFGKGCDFDDWLHAWQEAESVSRRRGLLHEIYNTTGWDAFIWLLELADEYRSLSRHSRYQGELVMIAEEAVEMAVKRTLKGEQNLSEFSREPQEVACLFWFMRVEDGRFVNMSRLELRNPHAAILWEAVEKICTLALFYELDEYREEAVYILHAMGKLSLLMPVVKKFQTGRHPWTALDTTILKALKALALQDAAVLGGNTVEFALVHGSESAALYTLATQAQRTLHKLQGSK